MIKAAGKPTVIFEFQLFSLFYACIGSKEFLSNRFFEFHQNS